MRPRSRTKPDVRVIQGGEIEAQRKQRLGEAILNSFTDSVHVIPANRYLTMDESESDIPILKSSNYKSWLHNQSLSRSGFKTFQSVREQLNKDPFGYGDISFVKDDQSIDIMVDDGCGYRMPIASKGTGVQQILVLLGYMSATRARVICIEEPELNLSFKSQDDLITTLLGLLQSAASNVSQILFASHSDHVGSRGELQRIHVENPKLGHFGERRCGCFPAAAIRKLFRINDYQSSYFHDFKRSVIAFT